MSIEELRGYRNAEPFHPFTLLLHDGRLLQVERPLRIAFAPNGRRVAVFDGDKLNVLALEQIRSAAAEGHPSGR